MHLTNSQFDNINVLAGTLKFNSYQIVCSSEMKLNNMKIFPLDRRSSYESAIAYSREKR
jgi:hypothetical protein